MNNDSRISVTDLVLRQEGWIEVAGRDIIILGVSHILRDLEIYYDLLCDPSGKPFAASIKLGLRNCASGSHTIAPLNYY